MSTPTMLSDEITIGEKYGPAAAILDQEEADAYFKVLVEHNMRVSGNDRDEAEDVERTNLGYYAGYYDNEVRLRVESLFRCQHPMLGKASRGTPTPEEAFEMGKKFAAGTLETPIDDTRRVDSNGTWFNDGKGK